GDVHRWAIIERTNANAEHLAGDFACFLRQSIPEVDGDIARREYAGALRCEPQEVFRALLVELQEGVEDRRDQDSAARVCLGGTWIVTPRGLPRDPFRLVPLRHYPADEVAQGAVAAGRLAELHRQHAEQVLLAQVAAGFGDLVLKRRRHGEVL